MAKTHMQSGSKWSVEEEEAAYRGYKERKTAEQIAETFPTDRHVNSIQMKLDNHAWEASNGKRGLSKGNKWVKQKWVFVRAALLPYHFEQIKTRREEIADLRGSLAHAQSMLDYHQRRVDEMLYLPN